MFTVRLDYDVGTGCPDVDDFEALVTARLGYDPFVEAAPDHVLVQTTLRGSAIEGRIEWRDSTGTWTGDQSLPMASNDCRHLVRALAAALAVQIQLLATTTDRGAGASAPKNTGLPQAPAPQGVPKSAVAPIPPSGPAAPRGTEPPAHSAARGLPPVFAIGAGTSVGFGMSSGPVLLGRLLGSLAWQHVALELAAEASIPTTTRRSDGAGFSQQHLLASAAACAVLTRWTACLLANGGEVRMTGEEIDRPTSAAVPLVEAGARVGIVQVLGRHFFVNAHADGLANVIRWTGALDEVPVWTAPRFAAVLGVDAGFRSR